MQSYDLKTIAAAIEARRPAASALVVAIDGPSGAGKSRLARRIGRAIGEHTIVRMDHVVPGWDGLDESIAIMRPIVAQLRRREPARYRLWDWEHDRWGQSLDRPAAPTVVLEGCGSGSRALDDLVDYLIWVDAPTPVRHDRAIARDGETYAANWQRWAAQEQAHFAADGTRGRADLQIDGRRPIR